MANWILTATPLSCNDIPILAQILQKSFDYYANHNSAFFKEYLQALRTVVGLGFSAVLTDEFLLTCYQNYLNPFINCGKGDFKVHEGSLLGIAQQTAEMVRIATISFQALQYPRYYADYIGALHYVMKRIATIGELTDEESDADRILNYLMLR